MVVLEPGLVEAVNSLVDPESRGDPESPLCWTIKSTRVLARALGGLGYQVSHVRVAEILHDLHFSLQGNRKALRDKLTGIGGHQEKGARWSLPRICQRGKEWQPKDTPEKVGVHDFPDPKIGKTVPYGVYDVGANTGWVLVGADHYTAAFAVAALRRWWQSMGQPPYPDAPQLLICADAGGSADQTPTGTGCGKWSWQPSLVKPDFPSPFAISRPAQVSGTRSSTASSLPSS